MKSYNANDLWLGVILAVILSVIVTMVAFGVALARAYKVDCVYPEPSVMVCGESLRVLPSTPTVPTETPEIYRRVRQP